MDKKKNNKYKYKMPGWATQQIKRGSGLIEDICLHGIGHPNKVSLKELRKLGLRGYDIHGCDGCCGMK